MISLSGRFIKPARIPAQSRPAWLRLHRRSRNPLASSAEPDALLAGVLVRRKGPPGEVATQFPRTPVDPGSSSDRELTRLVSRYDLSGGAEITSHLVVRGCSSILARV